MQRPQSFVRQARLFLIMASIPAVTGCDANGGKHQFRFESTDEPQHVVFLVEPWDGGGGDAVLTDPSARGTLHFKGEPVYVQWKAQQQIRGPLGPQPQGNADGRILVEAKVRLESATTTVSTNPPSKRKIFRVVIDKLIHAEWYIPT